MRCIVYASVAGLIRAGDVETEPPVGLENAWGVDIIVQVEAHLAEAERNLVAKGLR